MHRVSDSRLTLDGVAIDEYHPLESTPPRRQLVVLADGRIAVTTPDQMKVPAHMAPAAPWPTEHDLDPYEQDDAEWSAYGRSERWGLVHLAVAGVTVARVVVLAIAWAVRAGV